MQSFIFQVRFTKEHKTRFLSHRELMTLMERAVRRAAIPIKMSEGFNPRPRISFPTALALGIESADEVIYLVLDQWLNPQTLRQQLQSQLIDGIIIKEIIPVNQPAEIRGIEYLISLKDTVEMPSDETIKTLLSQKEIRAVRTKPESSKTVNIRPYINKIEVSNHNLSLSLKILPEGTARPEEVLNALGIPSSHFNYYIKKTKTIIQ